MLKRIITRLLTGILVVLVALLVYSLCLLGYIQLTYYNEMHAIEKKLNAIPGVSVIKIWGHNDITLEEVTARLRVSDRGEIVLYGLSNDVFNYPDSVLISEIDGKSFIVFDKKSLGSTIDIGRKGHFGKFLPFALKNEEDVVKRYDEITRIVRAWPVWPELLHFYDSNGEEVFLAILSQCREDRDKLFQHSCAELDRLFKLKDKLPWGTRHEGRITLR